MLIVQIINPAMFVDALRVVGWVEHRENQHEQVVYRLKDVLEDNG
jgi:arginine exporter protein ArgO